MLYVFIIYIGCKWCMLYVRYSLTSFSNYWNLMVNDLNDVIGIQSYIKFHLDYDTDFVRTPQHTFISYFINCFSNLVIDLIWDYTDAFPIFVHYIKSYITSLIDSYKQLVYRSWRLDNLVCKEEFVGSLSWKLLLSHMFTVDRQ